MHQLMQKLGNPHFEKIPIVFYTCCCNVLLMFFAFEVRIQGRLCCAIGLAGTAAPFY